MTNQNKPEEKREKPLIIQILVYGYAFFWLTMIFAAGLNSMLLGYIDIDSCSLAFFLTLGIYPLLKILDKMYNVLQKNIFVLLYQTQDGVYNFNKLVNSIFLLLMKEASSFCNLVET